MELIALLLLFHRVNAALWGNYKLYDSKGPGLYDYSGNGNHAEVSWIGDKIPIVTDRGQYLYDDSTIRFPTNIYKGYPSKSTMIIVMWLVAKDEGYLIVVESGSNRIYLYWKNNNDNVSIKFNKEDSTEYTTAMRFSNINLEQWNRIVFHLEQTGTITKADVYQATTAATNLIVGSRNYDGFQLNSATTTWSIKELQMEKIEVFIYEIWWLDSLETDIPNTLTSISFAMPVTFTSPVMIEPYRTYNGTGCDSICTGSKYSCSGSSSNCIKLCVDVCTCGCYKLTTASCLSCSWKNCLNFNIINDTCSQCNTGYYKSTTSPSLCQSCTSSCPTTCNLRYYFDPSNNACVECPPNCSSCTSNTACTGCNPGYALTSGTPSKLCSPCPTGQYAYNNSCQACPDLCAACTSSSICTSCKQNAFLDSTYKMCYCNSGYIKDYQGECSLVAGLSASSTMNSDGTLTLTFSQALSAELTASSLSFKDGLIIHDSSTFTLTAVTSKVSYTITLNKILLTELNTMRLYFPTGSSIIKSETNQELSTQYLDISITASSITTSCSSILNCSTCSLTESNFVCDSCRNSLCLYTQLSRRCGFCCDSGYYRDANSCKKCASDCYTCTNGSTCSSCTGSLYLLDNDCVSNCGSRKYKNSSNNTCTQCLESCYTCDDGLTCSSCTGSLYLLNNNCVADCGPGKYENSANNKCTPCLSKCYTCTDGTSCSSCTGSLYLLNNTCVADCEIGEYKNSSNNVCTSCLDKCYTCNDGSTCSSCRGYNYLLNNNCVEECGAGYYKETINNENKCTPCSTQCYTCTDISSCSSCTGSLYLLNNDCVSDCGSGKYKKSSNNVCTSCSTQCYTCTDISSCSSCTGSFYLLNNSCVADCGPGKYENSANNICSNCISNCEKCQDGISCTKCKTGFEYSSANNKCQACPELCKDCLNENECTSCVDNASLTGGICTCLSNYEESNGSCIENGVLDANAQMNSSGEIFLEFTRDLNIELTSSSITFTIKGITYSYPSFSMISISSKQYSITLINIPLVNSSDITINFTHPNSIMAADGSTLSKTSLLIEVPPELRCPSGYFYNDLDQKCTVCDIENCSSCKYDSESSKAICIECIEGTNPENIGNEMECKEDIPDSDGTKNELNDESSNNSDGSDIYSQADYLAKDPAAKEVASQGATASSSIITIAAAMSFSSTAGLWNLVNTIQLLSVLPLLNIELPIMVFATLTSMRSYNPIPNLVNYMMPEKGPIPFRRASLLGYETGQFLINIGDIVTTLFITFGVFPILIVINRFLPYQYHEKLIGKKVKQYIQDYKWNVFTRFYIESYIELAIAAFVQVFTMKDISEFADFNIMINIIISLIILVISI